MKNLPERHKKDGVRYAFAPFGSDGVLELPVIDVTHPAFALAPSDDELRARLAQFMAAPQPFARVPAFLRRRLLAFFLRKSILGRALSRAHGGFLTGLATYLFKLGSENLGEAYATAVDRRIAASLPALSVRLRLQDTATLLAEALAPRLDARPGCPLRLVNIAGGPAMDDLNALILLRRDRPGAVEGRRVRIDVLDVDADGPAFGARALAALAEPGGALAGLDARLVAVPSSWTDTGPLRDVLRALRQEGAVAAGSSEGGLFEYGSDQEISANLAVLRDEAPEDFVVVGSVTRDDEFNRRLRRSGGAATRPRGLEVFRALAGRSGWRVTRAVERLLSDQVVLERAG